MDIKACSVENAAETLGLEPEDVLELVKIGKLDAIKLKSKTIIPIVAIDNFLCGFSTNSSTNLDKGASDQVTSQQSKSKGDVDLRRELNSTDIIALALLEQRKERRKEKQQNYRANRKAKLASKGNESTQTIPENRVEHNDNKGEV